MIIRTKRTFLIEILANFIENDWFFTSIKKYLATSKWNFCKFILIYNWLFLQLVTKKWCVRASLTDTFQLEWPPSPSLPIVLLTMHSAFWAVTIVSALIGYREKKEFLSVTMTPSFLLVCQFLGLLLGHVKMASTAGAFPNASYLHVPDIPDRDTLLYFLQPDR